MSLPALILRGTAGAFLLQSGWGKKDLPKKGYEGLQEMAKTGVPQVADLDPTVFGKALAYGELGLGGALLTPVVSNRLAGRGLTAFSAGLLTMYFRNDEMTQDDGIRPSAKGVTLAKDSWLLAIGLALFFLKDKKKAKKDRKKKRKAEAKRSEDN